MTPTNNIRRGFLLGEIRFLNGPPWVGRSVLTIKFHRRKIKGINNENMNNIKKLTERIIAFRDARDWKQFHNPKDLAISLSLEAAEVLEHFQWKSEKEIENYIIEAKEHIGEELADVFYWVLLMGHDLNIDVIEALEKKIKKNEDKYPVEKAKGRHTKYNNL